MTAGAPRPEWLAPVVDAVPLVRPEQLSRFLPPPEGGRESAILVLFGDGAEGPDILLIQRSSTTTSHAG